MSKEKTKVCKYCKEEIDAKMLKCVLIAGRNRAAS